MTLYDIIQEWPDIKPQKQRQALQAIVNFIDYSEEDTEDLLYGILEYVSDNFEGDDYFGTEGLKV